MPDTPLKIQQKRELKTARIPIKVMGRREDGFAQSVSDIVQRHAPDFHPHTMEMRPSKNGRFISLTCTINAQSREQLDGLYMELTKHPMVMMVL